MALGIALPALICWGVGIPIFALFLMVNSSKRIDTVETRRKLGFLFNGFKVRYYYWEILIMFRKIMLIFIESFLIQFGVFT